MPVEWLSDELLTNGQDSPASQPDSPTQTRPLPAADLKHVLKYEDGNETPSNEDTSSSHVLSPKTSHILENRRRLSVKVNSPQKPTKDYHVSSGKSGEFSYSQMLTNSNNGGQVFDDNIKALYSNILSEGRDGFKKVANNVSEAKNSRQRFSGKSSRFCLEPCATISDKTPDNIKHFATDAWKSGLTMAEKANSEISVDAEETYCCPNPRAPFGVGEPCHVCGEKASGNFFGALVCLPCKSFFIRCTKEGEPAFVSQCDGRCDVSKQGRNRCQHCRYEKCLAAGMSRKEKPETIEPGEGQLLCRVCGDIANGIHFGVYTCEGCKKFFRRGLLEYQSYVCKGDMSCVLNPRNRNNCRYCRYQKCLNVGMSRGAIKMGRPKKLVKDQNMRPLPVSMVSQNSATGSGERVRRIVEPVFAQYLHNSVPSSDSEYSDSTARLTRQVSLSSESDSSFGEEAKSDLSDDITNTENSRAFLPIKKCILRSLLTKEEAALLNIRGDADTDDLGHASLSDNKRDSVFPGGLNITGGPPSEMRSHSQEHNTVVAGSDDDTSTSMLIDYDGQRKDIYATFKLSTKDTLQIPTSHSFPSEKHFHKAFRHSIQRRKSNSPISNCLSSTHDVQEEHSRPKRRKSDNDSPGLPSSPLNHFAETFFNNNQKTTHISDQTISQRKMAVCDWSETPVFHSPSHNTCAVKPLDLSWPDVNATKTKQSQSNGLANLVTCFPDGTESYCPRDRNLRATSKTCSGSCISQQRTFGKTETSMLGKRQNESTVGQCQPSQTRIHHIRHGTSRFQNTHENTQMESTKQSVSTQRFISGLVEVPSQGFLKEQSLIATSLSNTPGKNSTGKAPKDKSLLISREMLDEVDNFFLSSFSLLKTIQQRLDKQREQLHHTGVDLNTHFSVTQSRTFPPTPQDSFGQACLGTSSDSAAETDTTRYIQYSQGMPPSLVLPEERHTAEKLESMYRFPPVHVCQYWNKLEPSQTTIQMSRDQHRVLQDMLEAYMEMLRNLGEGHIPPSESFSHIKTWPIDETAPIVEHVVRRILRQVKEELAFMCKVPGFNDFHPQDRIFIIHNLSFANVTLMATRDWYNPETETFQNMMNWNLPEGHPMCRFRQKAKVLAEQVRELKMDRTEAAMMSALNVAAADITDLEEPCVIERSRDFLISALTTHLSYKGIDPYPRMRQLFRLMPSFRLCGYWTKKLREEIALNRSGGSDKAVNVERLMQGGTHPSRVQPTCEQWDAA